MLEEETCRWNELFSKVKIDKNIEFITSTEEELLELEKRIQLKLPKGYVEFSQLFGQGCFGENWIFLSSPKITKIENQISNSNDILEAYKMAVEDNVELYRGAESLSLLRKAYVFGLSEQVMFFFSQGFLENSEEECDIYGVNDDGEVYDFGSDFFDFIKDCCLGRRIEEEFPSLLKFMVPLDKNIDEVITQAFIPIP